ncbi:MAG TPA: FAD-dependent oxidoreductase [Syntrophomonadaceae bacterium]|nr:FAD-dependent oxidoreductase [Syntrophomonadaceae bacterium]
MSELLRSPLMLGPIRLKNRIVMPAMGTGLALKSGEVSPAMIKYYEERARGGAGMIIVEIACVDSPQGRASLTQLNIDDPSYIAGLNELAEIIRSYDCRAFIQLHHAGRQTSPAVTGGLQPVAPSPIACRLMRVEPHELTIQEIEALKLKFVSAAYYAWKAGFDGVELHAAHGYLLSQFISPYSNRRNDEYGGSIENRARLLTEIIKEIKQRIPKLAVGVRLNLTDFVSGGMELEEGLEIAKRVEAAGADLLNVSGGIYESGQTTIEPASFAQGWRIYLAEAVKEVLTIPVLAGGVIRDPAYAEDLLQAGKTDLVWVGRGMIADPNWTNKALQGKAEDIRPCISCNQCIGRSFSTLHIKCTVNPWATQEWRQVALPDLGGKRAAVVGGGPAGMQAAITLAAAGCQVDLYEKEQHLGGLLGIASMPAHKERLAIFMDYLIRQVEKQETVSLHLNTRFDADLAAKEGFDAIILAHGARALKPELPGSTEQLVMLEDLMTGRVAAADEIAIIGGGSSGCELAEWLLDQGKKVFIIEQRSKLAPGLENMTRLDLLIRLKKKGLIRYTASTVMHIDEDGVQIINKDGKEEKILVDQVVLAAGYKADQTLYRELQKQTPSLLLIGDAAGARGIHEAVHEGAMAAYRLGALLS